MGSQQWYREKRIDLIKMSQDLLRELLLLDLKDLDHIPLSFFEKIEMELKEQVSRFMSSQGDVIDPHLCPNDPDVRPTTFEKNQNPDKVKKEESK